MRFTHLPIRILLAAGLIATIAPAVTAQSKEATKQSDETAEQTASDRDKPSRASNDRPPRANRRDRQLRPELESWVTIGVDNDNDGRFDTIERIYLFDLERAQRQSRNRMQERDARPGRQNADMERGSSSRRANHPSADDSPSLETVSGKLQGMQTVGLASDDQTLIVAKVTSDDDQTKVIALRPEEKLKSLGLTKGDQIEAKGVQVRIDDRPVVLVTQLVREDETVSLSLPERVNLKRVKARVLNVRDAQFRGHDKTFLVGRVRTRSGSEQLVNFGPKESFTDVDLQAEEVRLLVRPGRVGGQPAMIVQEVKVGDRTISLPRPDNRTTFRQPKK